MKSSWSCLNAVLSSIGDVGVGVDWGAALAHFNTTKVKKMKFIKRRILKSINCFYNFCEVLMEDK